MDEVVEDATVWSVIEWTIAMTEAMKLVPRKVSYGRYKGKTGGQMKRRI